MYSPKITVSYSTDTNLKSTKLKINQLSIALKLQTSGHNTLLRVIKF